MEPGYDGSRINQVSTPEVAGRAFIMGPYIFRLIDEFAREEQK
jgi:hypothetical protein